MTEVNVHVHSPRQRMGCISWLVVGILAGLAVAYWQIALAVAAVAVAVLIVLVSRRQSRPSLVVVHEGERLLYRGRSPIPHGVIVPGHDYTIESSGPYEVA